MRKRLRKDKPFFHSLFFMRGNQKNGKIKEHDANEVVGWRAPNCAVLLIVDRFLECCIMETKKMLTSTKNGELHAVSRNS